MDAHQKARFLVASAPYTSDLLLALPIAAIVSCDFRLDNGAVRIAVALRLSMTVRVPTCVDVVHKLMPVGLVDWCVKELPAE